MLLVLPFLGAQPVMAQQASALMDANAASAIQVEPRSQYPTLEEVEAQLKAQAERERAEAAERRRQREQSRRQARGWISISLLGSYGALWIEDGQGSNQSDATSTKGLGARITYSLNSRLAFEAELMVADSGEARLERVRIDGVEGDLTRDATLGRFLGGALLRFSSGRVIPLVRAGLGVQGASVDARFTTSRRDQPAIGPATVFDLSWYAGAGVDMRLGPLDAGLRLSAVAPVTGFTAASMGPGALEAALHVGFSWDPH